MFDKLVFNQDEDEKIEEDTIKVEESKTIAERNRMEVKVEHAEPCEATTQSATEREEVMRQDEAGTTPTHTNHIKTRLPRSNKTASLTPVSAVSDDTSWSVRKDTFNILLYLILLLKLHIPSHFIALF